MPILSPQKTGALQNELMAGQPPPNLTPQKNKV